MWSFYLRLLKRQTRLPAIRLFTVAVTLACAVTFSITLLSDRLENLFQQQSKEVLAADLLLTSSSKLNREQQIIVDQFNGKKAQTLTFQTMAAKAGSDEDFVLSSVKASSDLYPLLGELQVSDQLYGAHTSIQRGPKKGMAWVEERILLELEAKVGEQIEIGKKTLTINKVLIYEPDKGNSFYSFTPRVLMHLDDVGESKVIQAGSRAKYGYLFASQDQLVLESLQKKLEQKLQANQKFVTIESANQTLANTLTKAYQFLTITALIAILLGATGVALVSYQYANEMTYQYAIFRCLGLRGWQLRSAIIIPIVFFTGVAILFGLLLGGAAHYGILQSLASVLPKQLPAPSAQPFIISSLTAVLVVISFAWPFLKQLISTAPKQLLNQQQPVKNNLAAILISITLGLFAVIYLNLQEIKISFYLVLGLAAFILLSLLITHFLIKLIQWLGKNSSPRTQLSIRIFSANRRISSLQIIALAITFFSLALIQTLRDDLIDSWQDKVPEHAPNFFALNIFADELQDFRQQSQTIGAKLSPLYPIVRGRLSQLNHQAIADLVEKGSQADRAINRDLSLTWEKELPFENEIIEGQWIDHSSNQAQTSMEQELAKSMGVKLGDTLIFVIETVELEVTVTSIRKVSWESFTPNFYFFFNKSAIENFPATYLASFYLAQENKKQLSQLLSNFPSASIFDVDFLLKKVRSIIAQVSFAIESILYFALAASIIVFIAIEMILHHNRIYTTAILKAAGSQVAKIQSLYRLQFILIGLLSGTLAYLLNSAVSYISSVWIMKSAYLFNWKILVLCCVITPILVLFIGQLSINRSKDVSAKKLLSD